MKRHSLIFALLMVLSLIATPITAMAGKIAAYLAKSGTPAQVKPVLKTLAVHARDFNPETLNTQIFDRHDDLPENVQRVREFSQKKVIDEAGKLWSKFSSKSGISKQGFVQYLQELEKRCVAAQNVVPFATSDMPAEDSQMVQQIIRDIGYDPSPLQVVQVSDEIKACSSYRLLALSSSILHKHTPGHPNTIIPHETAHIIHLDSLLGALAQILLSVGKLDADLVKELINFMEVRADIFAATRGLKYAQSASDDFAKFKGTNLFELDNQIHPSPKARLRLAQDIIKLMNN